MGIAKPPGTFRRDLGGGGGGTVEPYQLTAGDMIAVMGATDGGDRFELATAIADVLPSADDGRMIAIWACFTRQDALTRADMIGDLAAGPDEDGPLQRGEWLVIDGLKRGTGRAFTPAETEVVIDGMASSSPPTHARTRPRRAPRRGRARGPTGAWSGA